MQDSEAVVVWMDSTRHPMASMAVTQQAASIDEKSRRLHSPTACPVSHTNSLLWSLHCRFLYEASCPQPSDKHEWWTDSEGWWKATCVQPVGATASCVVGVCSTPWCDPM